MLQERGVEFTYREYTRDPLSAEEIREAITRSGLPNIAVPREIKVLEEIPVLGSGKTNYPELSKLVAG